MPQHLKLFVLQLCELIKGQRQARLYITATERHTYMHVAAFVLNCLPMRHTHAALKQEKYWGAIYIIGSSCIAVIISSTPYILNTILQRKYSETGTKHGIICFMLPIQSSKRHKLKFLTSA